MVSHGWNCNVQPQRNKNILLSETRSLSMKLITATSVVSTAPHACTWSGKGFAACAGQPRNSEKFRKSCRGLRKLRLQKPPRFLGTTTDFNDGLLVCLDSLPTKYVKYAMWFDHRCGKWRDKIKRVMCNFSALQSKQTSTPAVPREIGMWSCLQLSNVSFLAPPGCDRYGQFLKQSKQAKAQIVGNSQV